MLLIFAIPFSFGRMFDEPITHTNTHTWATLCRIEAGRDAACSQIEFGCYFMRNHKLSLEKRRYGHQSPISSLQTTTVGIPRSGHPMEDPSIWDQKWVGDFVKRGRW